jgi:hypothetical protein
VDASGANGTLAAIARPAALVTARLPNREITHAASGADGGQVVRLGGQRERVHHHEPGQVRHHARRERARAELRERLAAAS